MKKSQQIVKPNRLALAIQELNGMVSASDVPTTINGGEAEGYVFVGVKSSDNQSGTAKVHKAKLLYATLGKHQEMVKMKHVFNGLFNGMFNKLVILHNPTLPLAAEEKPKVKGLSPTHKSKVKELAAAGVGALEIASELEIKVERVEAYLNK